MKHETSLSERELIIFLFKSGKSQWDIVNTVIIPWIAVKGMITIYKNNNNTFNEPCIGHSKILSKRKEQKIVKNTEVNL